MAVAASDQYDRCLVGQDAAVSVMPTDEDGEAQALASPASVSIADGAGAAVGVDIPATVSEDGQSVAATIPAESLALLDTFTLTWAAKVGGSDVTWETELETVGGYYFTFAAFRAQGQEFAAAAATDVRLWRQSVEDFIERTTKCSYVPRGRRQRIHGDGSPTLVLERWPVRDVYSLSVEEGDATTVWTSEEIAALEGVDNGMLALPERWTGAWPAGQAQPGIWKHRSVVTIHYAHGLDRPSKRMSRAALYLARQEAFPDTRTPPNIVLQATEFGNFRVATPDVDHATGIPWIDELLDREGHAMPSVG